MSIDTITMVMVMDDDVTAGRNRRSTDVEEMQELICSQVSRSLISFALACTCDRFGFAEHDGL